MRKIADGTRCCKNRTGFRGEARAVPLRYLEAITAIPRLAIYAPSCKNKTLNRLTKIGVTTKMSMEDDENEQDIDDLDEDGWEEDSEDDA